MQLFAWWMLGTALLLAGGLIWAFAPILIPMLAVAIGLGGVVAGVIALARRLEQCRGSR